MVAWGVVMTLMSLVKNYEGLVVYAFDFLKNDD
jgi:hypothetical protein